MYEALHAFYIEQVLSKRKIMQSFHVAKTMHKIYTHVNWTKKNSSTEIFTPPSLPVIF